jgi:hypothetical protein
VNFIYILLEDQLVGIHNEQERCIVVCFLERWHAALRILTLILVANALIDLGRAVAFHCEEVLANSNDMGASDDETMSARIRYS